MRLIDDPFVEFVLRKVGGFKSLWNAAEVGVEADTEQRVDGVGSPVIFLQNRVHLFTSLVLRARGEVSGCFWGDMSEKRETAGSLAALGMTTRKTKATAKTKATTTAKAYLYIRSQF